MRASEVYGKHQEKNYKVLCMSSKVKLPTVRVEIFLKQHLTYYWNLVETELAEIMKPPVIMPLDLIRMLT